MQIMFKCLLLVTCCMLAAVVVVVHGKCNCQKSAIGTKATCSGRLFWAASCLPGTVRLMVILDANTNNACPDLSASQFNTTGPTYIHLLGKATELCTICDDLYANTTSLRGCPSVKPSAITTHLGLMDLNSTAAAAADHTVLSTKLNTTATNKPATTAKATNTTQIHGG